jgi:glutathione synthase/RimK-type ligase-like ATP-grasp enzyme
MILLLGSADFYQANRVKESLFRAGRDFIFLDFNGTDEITFEFDSEIGFRFLFNGIDLSCAKLVWRSAKFLYRSFGDDQEWADKYIAKNMQRMNYRNFLSVCQGKIVNPVEATFLSSHKMLQIKIAKDLGFKVPRSIVSNNIDSINKWRRGNEDLITKCIDESFIPIIKNGVQQRNISTSKIDYDYLTRKENRLEPFQVFIQENIKKKWEHRCIYVAGVLFNFRIDSKQHAIMETDYRNGGMMVDYTPWPLPKEIHDKVIEYAIYTNLFSGCFDLIEDVNGDFIFLEVNPEGVWGLHDDIMDGKISKKFAEALIDEADRE